MVNLMEVFMKLQFKILDRILITEVTGEIDHHTASEIKAAIIEQYALNSCVDIVFDFTNLYFMDSAGIGMLIGRYKQACINGGVVYAAGVSPAIERIFDLSGLNKIIKRYPTVEDAINSRFTTKEVI